MFGGGQGSVLHGWFVFLVSRMTEGISTYAVDRSSLGMEAVFGGRILDKGWKDEWPMPNAHGQESSMLFSDLWL